VLVLDAGDGAQLPFAEVDGYANDELPRVRDALTALLGVQTVVVRPVARSIDEEAKVLQVGFEVEALEAVSLRPGSTWIGRDEAAALSLPDLDRELVQKLLGDRPPPERPEWSYRGWFAEASAWIESALATHGRSLAGSVEQISNWCISSILRAPTTEGNVYFKATARSPLFADEGAVTSRLAAIFPDNVPLPLTTDSDRRWMLLDDFGPKVGWKASLETRIEVLSLFGRMQVASSSRTDELEAIGAFDRRPDWLAREGASLLADTTTLDTLDSDEADRLTQLVPRLVESCRLLAAGPVPDALVHGDLHMDNVARRDGGYVFFDWTDACVTHPFLDLLAVVFEDDLEPRDAMRDAYLAAWAEYASGEELRELWRLAEPLASLNQAVSYRYILDSIEPGTGDEFESMLPYFLRKVLAAGSED
jgi:hypothetical protein